MDSQLNMIPVSQPKLSQKDIDYVTDAVKSGWVSSLGSYIDAFEKNFAEFCGVKYAVSVSNGTVGLHLALKVLGIGENDEVIVPDLTFVATANAVKTAHAEPVMVDVCRDTYCINPKEIVKAITSRTRAIIPVHLYGHPSAMTAIMKIAKQYNLAVIEDAAEAHGAEIDGKKVGSIGHCGVFSFYGNKIITSGEGGMITTNDIDFYNRAKLLRDHAMSKEVRYWHTEIGYNYRMTNLQAALGVAQLEQIHEFINFRQQLLRLYQERLTPKGIECNPNVSASPVNWMVCAVVEGISREARDRAIKEMRKQGVDARPFFYPISMLPMYKQVSNPISYKLSEIGFNLPTYVGMTEADVDRVCNVFFSLHYQLAKNPMRIGIDLIGCISGYVGGVNTFSQGLTKGIIDSANEDDSIILIVSDKNQQFFTKIFSGSGVSFLVINSKPIYRFLEALARYLAWIIRDFRILYWYQKIFYRKTVNLIDVAVDVVVVPTTILNFYTLKPPTILCMHDIQQEYLPHFFSIRERIARWATFRASCWKATAIQSSSQYIKDCLLEKFTFLSSDKIFIAHEGVDFEKFNPSALSEKPVLISEILSESFLFYPAQLWPHKNHSMLIDALAIFRDKYGYEMPCILTGQDYGTKGVLLQQIKANNLNKVIYLGRVNFQQLIWLYQNCRAVLALGLHESSSLPAREGAAFGKPIICTNIPPNIETQLFLSLAIVDCHNPKNLAGMISKIHENESSIIEDSFANIERSRIFDWKRIASSYLEKMHELSRQ